MREVLTIDGAHAALARISVFDRGFLYGDSAFEVLRTYGGLAVLADAHMKRLVDASEVLGFEGVPAVDALAREVHDAVAAAALADGEEAVVRVIVTRGEGAGLDVTTPMQSTRVVTVSALPTSAGVPTPVDAIALPHVPAPVPGIKSGAYVANVMARRSARAAGAGEAIFVGAGDVLVEAAGANVFARFGMSLYTAPLEAGVLPGITRAHVAEIAAAEGLTVRFEAPRLADRPDEIFLTSSVRGVVAVRRLWWAETALFEGNTFPWAERLRESFLRRVETLKSRPSLGDHGHR